MRKPAGFFVVLGLLSSGSSLVLAQSDDGTGFLPGSRFERKLGTSTVCTATNALKDQKCSISCSSQQTAACEDADGGDTPSCSCTKD